MIDQYFSPKFNDVNIVNQFIYVNVSENHDLHNLIDVDEVKPGLGQCKYESPHAPLSNPLSYAKAQNIKDMIHFNLQKVTHTWTNKTI